MSVANQRWGSAAQADALSKVPNNLLWKMSLNSECP